MDVNAVFAADLDKLNQNWISEDLIQRLQLTRTFNSEGEAEYGRLEKTFQFRGSLVLRWAEKGGHKSTFTSCRIVPSRTFDLLLQSSLLPLPIPEKRVLNVDLTQAPPLSSLSLEETHLSTASTSTISSVGSFHTEPKVIEENSEKYDTFPHLITRRLIEAGLSQRIIGYPHSSAQFTSPSKRMKDAPRLRCR